MDEPFGPLDAMTRIVLQQELLSLWERDRKAILFVTHDLAEAIALADTVVVMTAGPGRVKATIPIPLRGRATSGRSTRPPALPSSSASCGRSFSRRSWR